MHRQTLTRRVQAPRAQWMYDGQLVGLVESPAQSKRLVLNRFGVEGQDGSVILDFAQAYLALGVPPAASYGVKNVTRYQFEVVGPESWNKERMMAALGEAPDAARAVMAECFQKEIDGEKARTAQALQQRVHALQTRLRVFDESGVEIGLVPSIEQETVILAERLSSRISTGFFNEFRLLEYTPQQGIDAAGLAAL